MSGFSRFALLIVFCALWPLALLAQSERPDQAKVMRVWYDLTLDLVRHTPTYTPPVASRALGYIGVTTFEATASGDGGLMSLAGQLNGLSALPERMPGEAYDEALVLHSALSTVVAGLFRNTGPTGQRALNAVTEKLGAGIADGLDDGTARRSTAYGKTLGTHILTWAAADGGAEIVNLGFSDAPTGAKAAGGWVPTSSVALQQTPLLPGWGQNRPFAMPEGTSCPLPPPPAYSEDPASDFYAEAREVHETSRALTPQQAEIARFWADDAMLSRTPPGHWIAIALQVLDEQGADPSRRAEVLALLGIGLADAFIGCWQAKFEYDLLRPITYIRRTIDPAWAPLLNTPPFPEYPSGHSTQSAAAAEILTDLFGENFAFEDRTPTSEGLKARSFTSFRAAADEAGISRLYGGIHFRAAIERGLEQGRCIARFVTVLQSRRS
ncbi:MAG TPA: vanadium-dependent haloperoxidase [Paracoccaceae bacterium]|nr:vanadium-dependent haloperoxidase [Paracoccaceae bacterium]